MSQEEQAQDQVVNEQLRDASVADSMPASQSAQGAQGDGQWLQMEINSTAVTKGYRTT